MPSYIRCPRCNKINKGKCPCVQAAYDKERGTATERGYDSKWRKVRAEKLKRDPLCFDCTLAGRVTPANEVHHIVKVKDAPKLRLDMRNLMSLCKPCHSIRTLKGE